MRILFTLFVLSAGQLDGVTSGASTIATNIPNYKPTSYYSQPVRSDKANKCRCGKGAVYRR